MVNIAEIIGPPAPYELDHMPLRLQIEIPPQVRLQASQATHLLRSSYIQMTYYQDAISHYTYLRKSTLRLSNPLTYENHFST